MRNIGTALRLTKVGGKHPVSTKHTSSSRAQPMNLLRREVEGCSGMGSGVRSFDFVLRFTGKHSFAQNCAQTDGRVGSSPAFTATTVVTRAQPMNLLRREVEGVLDGSGVRSFDFVLRFTGKHSFAQNCAQTDGRVGISPQRPRHPSAVLSEPFFWRDEGSRGVPGCDQVFDSSASLRVES